MNDALSENIFASIALENICFGAAINCNHSLIVQLIKEPPHSPFELMIEMCKLIFDTLFSHKKATMVKTIVPGFSFEKPVRMNETKVLHFLKQVYVAIYARGGLRLAAGQPYDESNNNNYQHLSPVPEICHIDYCVRHFPCCNKMPLFKFLVKQHSALMNRKVFVENLIKAAMHNNCCCKSYGALNQVMAMATTIEQRPSNLIILSGLVQAMATGPTAVKAYIEGGGNCSIIRKILMDYSDLKPFDSHLHKEFAKELARFACTQNKVMSKNGRYIHGSSFVENLRIVFSSCSKDFEKFVESCCFLMNLVWDQINFLRAFHSAAGYISDETWKAIDHAIDSNHLTMFHKLPASSFEQKSSRNHLAMMQKIVFHHKNTGIAILYSFHPKMKNEKWATKELISKIFENDGSLEYFLLSLSHKQFNDIVESAGNMSQWSYQLLEPFATSGMLQKVLKRYKSNPCDCQQTLCLLDMMEEEDLQRLILKCYASRQTTPNNDKLCPLLLYCYRRLTATKHMLEQSNNKPNNDLACLNEKSKSDGGCLIYNARKRQIDISKHRRKAKKSDGGDKKKRRVDHTQI